MKNEGAESLPATRPLSLRQYLEKDWKDSENMNRKITIKREDRSGYGVEKQRFKGKAARTFTAALAAVILPLLVPVTAYAGDINSAEQRVLNTISEKQEYEGAYYKVTDGYIAKVTEYLSQDGIDMGRREADDYIAQFHANIGVGIASGYMEKVGDVAGTDPGTGADAGTGAAGDTDSGTGADSSTDSGSGDSAGTGTDADGNGGTGKDNGTAAGTDTDNGAGTGNAAGTAAAAGLGTDPEGDGPIEDNTVGSTAEGAVEYVVLPVEEETMYVQGIEELSVHEEAYKDSPVIGSVKEGEPVKITGAASTGWAQIAYGEKTGYVSAAYLRTQGYMDKKEAEKKATEEAEQKAQEEARKAEEAKKAEEEARKAEEAKKAEEAEEAAAQQSKDYSDAKPVENSINLGMIALGIAVVCAAALGGVLFYHKKKSRSGKR